MEKIKFIRFEADGNNEKIADQIVECYRNVFGEDPWNEWKRCQKCGKKFGIGQLNSDNIDHCNVPLVDFWPKEVVRQDIFNEMIDGTSCWLSMSMKSENIPIVIGFSWGYPIVIANLEKKIKLRGIAKAIADNFGSTDNHKVAYQDEIGLMAQYRGQKFGRAMQVLNLNDYINQGLNIIVARTKTNPPTVAYHWYKKAGMKVIAEYGDEDGRVILAGKLDQLIF